MWRIGVVLTWAFHRFSSEARNSVHLFSDATQQLLRNANEIEVFSLGGANAGIGPFHNARILGSAVIESKRLQKQLINRILIANRYNGGGFKCLGAEYGVRIRAEEGALDFTFCFDCGRVWVSGPDGFYDSGSTATSPASLMDQVLTKAGVPLPPSQHH